MTSSLNASIASSLMELGWRPSDGVAVALRTYATVVGPKEAAVYVVDYGPSADALLLVGDYQSEGRNVLESHGVLVPKNVSVDSLRAIVERFAAATDLVIANSYAARLLLSPEPDLSC